MSYLRDPARGGCLNRGRGSFRYAGRSQLRGQKRGQGRFQSVGGRRALYSSVPSNDHRGRGTFNSWVMSLAQSTPYMGIGMNLRSRTRAFKSDGFHTCDKAGSLCGYLTIRSYSDFTFSPHCISSFTVVSISGIKCSTCGKLNLFVERCIDHFDILEKIPSFTCALYFTNCIYEFVSSK